MSARGWNVSESLEWSDIDTICQEWFWSVDDVLHVRWCFCAYTDEVYVGYWLVVYDVRGCVVHSAKIVESCEVDGTTANDGDVESFFLQSSGVPSQSSRGQTTSDSYPLLPFLQPLFQA